LTQTSDEIYANTARSSKPIDAAGPDHVWSSSDSWTEKCRPISERPTENWKGDIQGIEDYVHRHYLTEDNVGAYSNGRTPGRGFGLRR
jgi:hypothetical protein